MLGPLPRLRHGGDGSLLSGSRIPTSNRGGTTLHFCLSIRCHGRSHWNEVRQFALDEEPESRLGT